MTNRVGGGLPSGFVICHWSFVIDHFKFAAGLETGEPRSLSAKCPRSPLQRPCRCRGIGDYLPHDPAGRPGARADSRSARDSEDSSKWLRPSAAPRTSRPHSKRQVIWPAPRTEKRHRKFSTSIRSSTEESNRE